MHPILALIEVRGADARHTPGIFERLHFDRSIRAIDQVVVSGRTRSEALGHRMPDPVTDASISDRGNAITRDRVHVATA